jgi:hypothetical protein
VLMAKKKKGAKKSRGKTRSGGRKFLEEEKR